MKANDLVPLFAHYNLTTERSVKEVYGLHLQNKKEF